jgi:hypothetical protein
VPRYTDNSDVPELIGYDSLVSIFSGAIMNNEPVKHDSQQESGEDILVPTVTDEGLEVASGIERRVDTWGAGTRWMPGCGCKL